jgi:Sec-independent protein translocase protein TatA
MFAEIFQPGHIVILATVLLISFGGPRIAPLGRGFSRAIQKFRASKDSAVVKRDIGLPV